MNVRRLSTAAHLVVVSMLIAAPALSYLGINFSLLE